MSENSFFHETTGIHAVTTECIKCTLCHTCLHHTHCTLVLLFRQSVTMLAGSGPKHVKPDSHHTDVVSFLQIVVVNVHVIIWESLLMYEIHKTDCCLLSHLVLQLL